MTKQRTCDDVRVWFDKCAREHGLSCEWTMALSPRLKRTLGTTECKSRKIVLNRHYALHCTTDRLLDLILHEMAHALVFEDYEARGRGPKDYARMCENAGHGIWWQSVARRIGANPARYSVLDREDILAMPPSIQIGWCFHCAKPVGLRQGEPRRALVHTSCRRRVKWLTQDEYRSALGG